MEYAIIPKWKNRDCWGRPEMCPTAVTGRECMNIRALRCLVWMASLPISWGVDSLMLEYSVIGGFVKWELSLAARAQLRVTHK